MSKRLERVVVASIVIALLTFSLVPIGVQGQGNDFTPPVSDSEGYENRAMNASANGSATFLRVEGYTPWAALVINAGSPEGVDMVEVSFDDDTDNLTITIQDSNETNHATVLVNKEFADEYIADSEGNLDINLSDAVNYEGRDDSNESAGNEGVYVFQIEHFSTQTIQISAVQNDFEPPVDGGQGFDNEAQNAAANGAVTFLRVEGYTPWAALVINAGDPDGVDAITVDFNDDTDTLTIEAQDSNTTNHVTILVNKEFADEYIAESEGDLDIETSDAVNYDGLNNSNESADGGGVYVFQIENFSTQTIDISAHETPFPGLPLIILGSIVPIAYYTYKKERR